MEKIKELFGYSTKDRKVYEFKPGVRTVNYADKLSRDSWFQQFNVSRLHGKAIVYFG